MARIVALAARPRHHLYVEFADGVAGEIDLSDRLFGPVFAPLQDEAVFSEVALDGFGAPVWPIGADLAPDAIYQTLRAAARRSKAP